MSESQIKELVAASDMIVNGYAFDRLGDNIRVINMNTGNAVILLPDGTVSEASMDDIEIDIVQDCFRRNAKFLVVENA